MKIELDEFIIEVTAKQNHNTDIWNIIAKFTDLVLPNLHSIMDIVKSKPITAQTFSEPITMSPKDIEIVELITDIVNDDDNPIDADNSLVIELMSKDYFTAKLGVLASIPDLNFVQALSLILNILPMEYNFLSEHLDLVETQIKAKFIPSDFEGERILTRLETLFNYLKTSTTPTS